MTRVFTCLGMMLVLVLTFTASTSFVSNGYQKVYGAADFSTSPSEFSIVKITLSGFPGQTGDSVTNVGLTPSPCRVHNDITCTGFSHIVIPGIGEGSTSVLVIPSKHDDGQTHLLRALIYGIISVACLSVPPPCSLPVVVHISFADQTSVTRTIDIPGIGSGQATVEIS
jgi:hypothetical protein